MMQRIRPKQAINSDSGSDDSSDDEDLKQAKLVMYKDNSIRKKSVLLDENFSSESEY